MQNDNVQLLVVCLLIHFYLPKLPRVDFFLKNFCEKQMANKASTTLDPLQDKLPCSAFIE